MELILGFAQKLRESLLKLLGKLSEFGLVYQVIEFIGIQSFCYARNSLPCVFWRR